ncbi:MAG: MMPL family transporter [bacterium]|nr:MMPL family transporter [bacterium]
MHSVLARGAIRRPWLTIALLTALVLAAAPGVLRLEVRTDGQALVPRDDPVIETDAEIRAHFGLRDPIVVLIETSHPDGVYNLDTLAAVQHISDALLGLEGVEAGDVTSLATEKRDRVYPGTLTFRPYLDPLPDTPQMMDVLRLDVDAAPILTGTLVSTDRRGVNVLVRVPDSEDGTGGRIDFYRRVLEAAKPFGTETDRVHVVGAPVAEALLGTHILEDLAVLLPAALAFVALVIWWGCRRFWGVALAFLEVGACLLVTFGVMGWLGFPVYLSTAVLPVILTSIGLADEIHIFWHYQRTLEADSGGAVGESDRSEPVGRTMDEMSRPVVFSSLTTSLAFLSFLASPIAPVWSFGLFAAFGVLFCMVWSLTVIPASLVLLPAEKMRRPAGGPASAAVLRRLATRISARPRRTLAAVAAASLALGLGVPLIQVQDSWLDGFARGSAFRTATDRANELLYGTHTLLVHLAFEPAADGDGGPLLQPALLETLGELEAFVRARPEVGGVLGPHSHLSTVAFMWLGRQEGTRRIPETPERVEVVLRKFDQGRGEHRRREVVDDDRRRTVMNVFLKEANYRDTATLMAAIRAWVGEHLAPLGARLDFAGDVAVSQAMIPAIVRTQVSSLLLALVGALLALRLLYRSFRTALLAILPTLVAVVWVFGFMGWLGIPLGVATSMFCAITLGIGVDYGIHFLERCRHAQARGLAEPAAHAAEVAGPAILTDALAISLGFGLLVISQVPANARLGLLVAAALAAASVLTLAGLTALLAVLPSARDTKGFAANGEAR